ncbi:hypothetical protein [Phenylobacterium sp.]|jgi:hypothetical protein|uniref:hypothetical protein n=1 Tax=Phenylobacterium sp. TaxID=1871053 RepID=UPI002E2F8DF0|nr:hypothetical protein [Phenylobacterium sp.]HEX3366676.1 hypothetical protein [Phenylobacterium sp.]
MLKVAAVAVAIAAIAGPPQALARPAPGWTVYADCAAAYLANARLADPDRPALMTAQVSDVADDYAAAAAKLRVRRGGSAAASRRAVEARIAQKTRLFAGQSREAVEHIIDACPQLGA